MYDLNGNEQVDSVAVDVDYRGGFPDVVMFDVNGDGTPEYFHVDENDDGQIDFVLVDVDGDGQADARLTC